MGFQTIGCVLTLAWFLVRKFFIPIGTPLLILMSCASLESEKTKESSVIKFSNEGAVLPSDAYSRKVKDGLLGDYFRSLQNLRKMAKTKLKLKGKKLNIFIHKNIKNENKNTVKHFASYKFDSTGANENIVNEVFSELKNSKLNNPDAIKSLDPQGDIGFCFGRAFHVHYMLKKRGVAQKEIAKIFVLGRLMHGKKIWNFHMATMVKGKDKKWWVIDSLFEKPLALEDWSLKAAKLGVKRKQSHAKIYITAPNKFQPEYGAYESSQFNIPELKSYFSELVLGI